MLRGQPRGLPLRPDVGNTDREGQYRGIREGIPQDLAAAFEHGAVDFHQRGGRGPRTAVWHASHFAGTMHIPSTRQPELHLLPLRVLVRDRLNLKTPSLQGAFVLLNELVGVLPRPRVHVRQRDVPIAVRIGIVNSAHGLGLWLQPGFLQAAETRACKCHANAIDLGVLYPFDMRQEQLLHGQFGGRTLAANCLEPVQVLDLSHAQQERHVEPLPAGPPSVLVVNPCLFNLFRKLPQA
mmetsp:Transcript_10019/g.26605  ORF Transcript_10019/g.26605 Transcript_10019/m.26605 type:complete len:238 (-) Transcript_10019:154-867(-)